MIRTAIRDDEIRGAQTLRLKLEHFAPDVEVLAVFTDPVAALEEIEPLRVDALFWM